jgi:hypothetical protein
MKYIITEQQNDRIASTIIEYFDNNLTPYDGWESHQKYKKGVKSDDEYFFHFADDWNETNHMWYSLCNNHNLSNPLDEGKCPVVTIPNTIYDALTAYFGNMWKPLFEIWFEDKTGLPVKYVSVLY